MKTINIILIFKYYLLLIISQSTNSLLISNSNKTIHSLTLQSNSTLYEENFKSNLTQLLIEYQSTSKKYISSIQTNRTKSSTIINPSTISTDLAYEIAYYASTSYCTLIQLQNWTCKACQKLINVQFQTLVQDDQTETQVVISIHPTKKWIILSFRGSSNLMNWLYNFQIHFQPLNSKNLKLLVHAGFLKCAQRLLIQYQKILLKLIQEYPNFQLVLTGHSLGGAIASLSSLLLMEQFQLNSNQFLIMTYGAPRVGNSEYIQFFNSKNFKSLRVTNKRDIVPHLPFRSLGYWHTFYEFWLNEKLNKLCSTDFIEDPNCALSMEPFLNVEDHLTYWDIRFSSC